VRKTGLRGDIGRHDHIQAAVRNGLERRREVTGGGVLRIGPECNGGRSPRFRDRSLERKLEALQI